MRLGHLILIIPLLLMAGCASNSEMNRPFLFKEAKLPAGFPEPGPVGEIIVKDYPAYRMARIQSRESGSAGDSNLMFRPLFNHIKRNDIPMTAPVEMGYPDQPDPAGSAASMAFLYGEPSWGTPGADVADQRVVVEDVPAMTVVSVGVRGGYTGTNFEKGLSQLNAWTRQRADQVRVIGPPRYLAYNSPFVPGFLRYGEVQLPVKIVGRPGESDRPQSATAQRDDPTKHVQE